jgi:hypothetical protein
MKREEEAIKETNESVGCESRDKVYPNSDNGGAAALKGGCGRKIVSPAWRFSSNEIFGRHPSHTFPRFPSSNSMETPPQ